MDTWNIILLSIIQGLTEFLPISSSGHLILAPIVFDFQDQGLALDAILHLGTLLAILIYFRTDLWDLFSSLVRRDADPARRRLAWYILWASIPAGLAGLFLGDLIESRLRSPIFVSLNLIFWSGIFFIADRKAKKVDSEGENILNLGFGKVLLVGFAQALALLPGTSRSGITITAGLFSKLSHTEATRFSFLLGAPIILAAGLYELAKFLSLPDDHFHYDSIQLSISFLVSFLVGYLSIPLLFKIVARVGLLPFIIYRVAIATIILITFSI
jgi:undecaprenyl-diphosphatase